MHFKKNVAIIVDAYVTGSFLAPALLSNGITCIHVRSQATIRDAVRAFYRPGDFIHETLYKSHDAIKSACRNSEISAPPPVLSEREIEVLRWTAEGKTSADIAEFLRISERTVNFHVNAAVAKLGAANKTSAAVRAAVLGLIW